MEYCGLVFNRCTCGSDFIGFEKDVKAAGYHVHCHACGKTVTHYPQCFGMPDKCDICDTADKWNKENTREE